MAVVKFTVTYFANYHRTGDARQSQYVTRDAVFDKKCKYWTSKAGDDLMTYFDVFRNDYRCAKTDWDRNIRLR